MIGQIEDVGPDGRVGRAGHGLRPDVAGQQGCRHAGRRQARHRPSRGRTRLPGPPLALRYLVAGYHDTHGLTCHRAQRAEPIVHGPLHPHSPRIFDAHGDTGEPTTVRAAAACPKSEPRHPRKAYAMTMNARIKSIVRGVKYKAQEAEGRAKQTAGKATGNDRLRRKGKAEELKSRLNQFAKKIKDAIRR
jgi:uncharacterized protein YjbJ (UPF0337 family)